MLPVQPSNTGAALIMIFLGVGITLAGVHMLSKAND